MTPEAIYERIPDHLVGHFRVGAEVIYRPRGKWAKTIATGQLIVCAHGAHEAPARVITVIRRGSGLVLVGLKREDPNKSC